MSSLQTQALGATGPQVSPIGLGCMAMSGIYGATDDAASLRAIHAALDAGINLIDTGDFYGMGHNEALVGRALKDRRDQAVLSVKFGALRGPDGAWYGTDTRPAAVKTFAAYSLQRLGVEVIDIYRPARLDPNVPIEDTIGAIADLIAAGYVKHIGLSEVGPDTIRRAHAVHPIVDLQIEYAVATRGAEARIFPVLDELGISATLYGVYSRGLLTGGRPDGKGDLRRGLPRFAQAEHNAPAVARFAAFAAERNLTPAQLAVAWVRARQPHYVPVLGAKTEAQLHDALGALSRPLSPEDVLAIEALFPPEAIIGDRYPTPMMAHLDSER